MPLVHKRTAKQRAIDDLNSLSQLDMNIPEIANLYDQALETVQIEAHKEYVLKTIPTAKGEKTPRQILEESGFTINETTGEIMPISVSSQLAKSNKRVEQRLETMRQITKPKEVQKESDLSGCWLYSLVDTDTGNQIGIFSTEDKAWAMSEELWNLYEIEADVDEIQVDADMYQLATRSPRR